MYSQSEISLQTTRVSGSVSSARKIRQQYNVNEPTRGSHKLEIIGRASFPILLGNIQRAFLAIREGLESFLGILGTHPPGGYAMYRDAYAGGQEGQLPSFMGGRRGKNCPSY